MNVTIVEYYIPGCGECIGIVENIVRSAVRDATVSRMNLVATANRHCHEVAPGPVQRRMAAGEATAEASPAEPQAPSGVLFSEAEVAGLARQSPGVPNGFDHTAG
jgi:hypothetical protein